MHGLYIRPLCFYTPGGLHVESCMMQSGQVMKDVLVVLCGVQGMQAVLCRLCAGWVDRAGGLSLNNQGLFVFCFVFCLEFCVGGCGLCRCLLQQCSFILIASTKHTVAAYNEILLLH